MTLAGGTRLGPYEIVNALGAGGMGEVYRARDTKLNRDVAIKVLPDAFGQDVARLARFTREAQTLAALNHPNIAHIHGLEDSAGVQALVMELVEGDDLSVHLTRGPMPLAEALPIARQIAEALEAAHDLGIVHRDLKPANIKVRPDGTVKVLDFGLAKAMDPVSDVASHTSGSALANSPTFTRQVSEAGMIVGTAAYMAPEQARGKAVDRRADIWAFGVVLFEMLSGTSAFSSDTVSDTIAAVLTREPDWRAIPPATPAPIRRLVQRCLERDVRRRLQAIGEARIVLEDPDAARTGSSATPPPARSTARWVATAIAAGLALFAAGWLTRPETRSTDGSVKKVDLAIDALEATQGRVPVISPDGSRVAYIAGHRLRVRPLDRLDAIELPDSDEVAFPAWSPDGRQLAYVRQGRVWKVSTDGGPQTDLGAVPSDLVGSGGGTWTSADEIVFAGSDTAGLWAIPAGGGMGRDLLPLDRAAESDFHEIAALPDGRGFIFPVHRNGRLPDLIAVFSGGTRRTLLELPGESLRHPVYSPTGHILYVRETTNPGIWAVPFSLDRLETTGQPLLVVPGGRAPSIARDGTLCFMRSDDTPVELVRVSRTGVIEIVTELAGTRTAMLTGGPTGSSLQQQWGGVSLSPDGRRVALSIGFSPGQLSVFDFARGSLSLVATGTFPSRSVWTRSGDVLIYASSREARAWNLWSRRADGAGEEQRYSTSEEVQLPSALSPDGTTLVFSEGSGPSGNFFKMSPGTSTKASPLFPDRVWGLAASFSPDGRYLAYESPESGRSEIFVRPFPEGNQRVQVSSGGGGSPVWAKNGEIFYVGGQAITAVSVSPQGSTLAVSKPVVLFQIGGDTRLVPDYDVTPDGNTFYMLRSRGREQVSLIFNWPRELARLAASDRPGEPRR
jgi:serine/threonine-protein kinase